MQTNTFDALEYVHLFQMIIAHFLFIIKVVFVDVFVEGLTLFLYRPK